MFKRIINITIWTLIGLYTSVIVLLHIPVVQTYIGECVANVLCEKFDTHVSVGRVDLGFINRLIIDDSEMQDQQGKQMLRVSRISVKINLLALAKGQIDVTSAQFFGLQANLYKTTPASKPNFQFVVDSLASKDSTKQKTPLDLQINSLIIRNGAMRYRVLSHVNNSRKFSPENINARNISAHIIVNRITDDSLNVKVKRIAFDERCGFRMKSLSLHAVYGPTGASVSNFRLELPATLVQSENITCSFSQKNGKIEMPTIQFKGSIEAPCISFADFAGFVPKLSDIKQCMTLAADFYGTGSSLNVTRLELGTNDDDFHLLADGGIKNYPADAAWFADVHQFSANHAAIASVVSTAIGKDVPAIISRIGDVSLTGYIGGEHNKLAANVRVSTSLGNIRAAVDKCKNSITGHIETVDFNVGKLADDNKLGHLSANINIHGQSEDNMSAIGRVYNFDYNGYKYRDINLDASYRLKVVEGRVEIDDPNAQISASGQLNIASETPLLKANVSVGRFAPNSLHLTQKWQSTAFAANISCDINGSSVNDADGTVEIRDFSMLSPKSEYGLRNVTVRTGFDGDNHFLNLNSDFGQVNINGHFNYNTIARSVLNMVAAKLPTIPGLTRQPQKEVNDFTINASISNTDWMKYLLGIPLEIYSPLNISGELNDKHEKIDLWCDVPSFAYDGNRFSDAFVNIESPNDTLKADIRIKKLADKGKYMSLQLSAGASDNHLNTSLSFGNNERHPLKGVINASTVFAKNIDGVSTAYVDVLPSRATIGDTTWHVAPSTIVYSKNHLEVNGFSISHGNQMLAINGTATNNYEDSLLVTLNDIDVSYVLNLVNFHSVDFFGMASGNARVAGVFSGKPQLAANLRVSDFKFESGRMGTLFANVDYDFDEGNINIDAVAQDEDGRHTDINGYVSPKHNYIDLGIDAHRTRAEFMESFCGSFMDNVDADINGKVNVVGPLNNINLVGKAAVNGSMRMTALNTTYWLRGDSVTFIPDEIIFNGNTIYDHNGNTGILTGSLHHQHLTNLSYDLNIKTRNLLAYDTKTFGDNTFYGTAYFTGDCSIKGRSGEVVIDVDGTPEKNSMLVYNVSDQGSIGSNDFIKWTKNGDAASDSSYVARDEKEAETDDISTNIRLNFLINCNPDVTLKLLMDLQTGDYITLNGDGMLRASYFNKGAFQMFGNYTVDHGVYKLTIQNILKKDFDFVKGGTITFGGDPYNAVLDLKAQYVLNSVSLADLNIGRSFTNNNVRVNCVMNITGSPYAPKVDFDLDMPSLSNDVKQMVYSLLNAEEEKKQQVLCLQSDVSMLKTITMPMEVRLSIARHHLRCRVS